MDNRIFLVENDPIFRKRLESLNDFIQLAIEQEFSQYRYTGNAVKNNKKEYIYNPDGTVEVDIKFPKYSWVEYQRSKTIVPTYSGYYDDSLNYRGSMLVSHFKTNKTGKDTLAGGYTRYYVRKYLGHHFGWQYRILDAVSEWGKANNFTVQ